MMGILGIKNRTENWKTAQRFAPFVASEAARAALARKLGESEDILGKGIRVELYWYGMRDWVKQLKDEKKPTPTSECLAECYSRLFGDLHERIEKVDKFNTLKPDNYSVSTQSLKDRLHSNLTHTEIDIVLETQEHLFIGEAKDESPFGVEPKYVLVHQLIREYVMAKTLVDLISKSDKNKNRKIIPFVVGDDPEKLKKILPQQRHIHQVGFMLNQCWPDGQCWLKEKNILSWSDIENLANENSNPGA